MEPRIDRRASKWLTWDASQKTGTFAGMYLTLRPFAGKDRLPHARWKGREDLLGLHAEGRLSDDTFDDFDGWLSSLAVSCGGVIFDYQQSKFTFVPFDEAETRAAMEARIASGDFEALAKDLQALLEHDDANQALASHAPKAFDPEIAEAAKKCRQALAEEFVAIWRRIDEFKEQQRGRVRRALGPEGKDAPVEILDEINQAIRDEGVIMAARAHRARFNSTAAESLEIMKKL